MTRRTTWAGALALALAVAGCGGGSSGSGAAPAAATTGSTASPATTPSSTTSSAAGPTVPPAAGPRVRLTRFTARAPADWRLDHSFGKEIVFASDRRFGNELTYSDTSIYPGTSLARAQRIVARNDDWAGAPKDGGRVTLAGRTFFHLLGPAGQGRWYDVYASPDGNRLLQLGFRTELSRPKRERLVASVLATVRLR